MLAKMKKEKTLESWQVEDAQRLRQLFEARAERGSEGKTISQMEFGAKYGIGTQGMVWQYLSARRPLNIKAAVAFARGLGAKVSDFSAILANQIEEASQMEGDRPVLQVVQDQVASPQLQWVTEQEAKLLANFRACGDSEKAQAMVYVDSLPKTIKRAPLRDNA